MNKNNTEIQNIADQILLACATSLERFKQAKTEEEKQMIAVTEFMTGITQTVDFIIRNNGTITSQQIRDAMDIVSKELGVWIIC